MVHHLFLSQMDTPKLPAFLVHLLYLRTINWLLFTLHAFIRSINCILSSINCTTKKYLPLYISFHSSEPQPRFTQPALDFKIIPTLYIQYRLFNCCIMIFNGSLLNSVTVERKEKYNLVLLSLSFASLSTSIIVTTGKTCDCECYSSLTLHTTNKC